MVRYAKPGSLREALDLLQEGQWRILAGGTDFYPALGGRPLREDVLDINGLAELREISETPHHIRIGGRASWTDIAKARLPSSFDALKLAAREVGSIQIQNAGTVAGNLCNASPAADGVPALMVLDAEVELRSVHGTRYLSLEKFILGNRKTAIGHGELVAAVRVPKTSIAGQSGFIKLGARRYLVISIAMAAARIAVAHDGTVTEAAIAIGACSVVAQRMRALEAALIGRPADSSLAKTFEPAHFVELSPIDDVRGSAQYRRAAAREITIRAVLQAIGAERTETEPERTAAA